MTGGVRLPRGSNPQDLPPIAALGTVVAPGFESPRLAAYSGLRRLRRLRLLVPQALDLRGRGGCPVPGPHPTHTTPPLRARGGLGPCGCVGVGGRRVGPHGWDCRTRGRVAIRVEAPLVRVATSVAAPSPQALLRSAASSHPCFSRGDRGGPPADARHWPVPAAAGNQQVGDDAATAGRGLARDRARYSAPVAEPSTWQLSRLLGWGLLSTPS